MENLTPVTSTINKPLDMYKEALNKDLLSKEETFQLISQAQNGDQEARTKLIERNIRLVNSVVKKYSSSCKNVNYADLIQVGQIGLIKAIDKFNPEKNTVLSTYATSWIKREVLLELSKQSNFNPPEYMKSLYRTVMKIKTEQNLTSIKDITNYLNNHIDLLPKSTRDKYCNKLDEELVSRIIKTCSMNIVSYDRTLCTDSENDSSRHEEIISEQDIVNKKETLDEIVERNQLRELLIQKIKSVTSSERDANIIIQKYGLIEGNNLTLEEIGQQYNLTKMRVSQICNKALDLMKQDKSLREFYV